MMSQCEHWHRSIEYEWWVSVNTDKSNDTDELRQCELTNTGRWHMYLGDCTVYDGICQGTPWLCIQQWEREERRQHGREIQEHMQQQHGWTSLTWLDWLGLTWLTCMVTIVIAVLYNCNKQRGTFCTEDQILRRVKRRALLARRAGVEHAMI